MHVYLHSFELSVYGNLHCTCAELSHFILFKYTRNRHAMTTYVYVCGCAKSLTLPRECIETTFECKCLAANQICRSNSQAMDAWQLGWVYFEMACVEKIQKLFYLRERPDMTSR